jgi:hypothetical protein
MEEEEEEEEDMSEALLSWKGAPTVLLSPLAGTPARARVCRRLVPRH